MYEDEFRLLMVVLLVPCALVICARVVGHVVVVRSWPCLYSWTKKDDIHPKKRLGSL